MRVMIRYKVRADSVVLHAVQVVAATEERIAAAYQPWSSSSGAWSAPLPEGLSKRHPTGCARTGHAVGEELSHQLLATEEEIHGAFRYGTERGFLSISGGEETFTVMPCLPPQPEMGRKGPNPRVRRFEGVRTIQV